MDGWASAGIEGIGLKSEKGGSELRFWTQPWLPPPLFVNLSKIRPTRTPNGRSTTSAHASRALRRFSARPCPSWKKGTAALSRLAWRCATNTPPSSRLPGRNSGARLPGRRLSSPTRGEFERHLAETQSEFMRQVAEARSEFARRLVETRSKSRRIAGAANNRIERAPRRSSLIWIAGTNWPAGGRQERGFATICGPVRKSPGN